MAYKKLTKEEWDSVEKLLSQGETVAKVARDFGVSYNTIKNHTSSFTSPKVIEAAQAVADSRIATEKAALALSKLTPSQKPQAISIAETLSAIKTRMAQSSELAAGTNNIIHQIVNIKASKLDEQDPDLEEIRTIHGLLETANKAAYQPLELLKANKGELIDDVSMEPLPKPIYKIIQ